ncbi:MAG: CorA family divalent cation transporter [Bacteroidota bacterium]
MVRNLTANKDCDYEWIDITNPMPEELQPLSQKYGLHEASLKDCLQPGHLPKYEQFRNYTFMILRVYSEVDKEADTVQEITNKIAIFMSDKFLITIHRKSCPPLERLEQEFIQEKECRIPIHLLTEIVKAGLHTFDDPGYKITESIEYYETQVFLTTRQVQILKGLYFIKRKLDVIRRLLLLSYDIVDKIDPAGSSNAYTRDVRDLYVKQRNLYDALSDNTNHLVNIYFNISAQRTNDTIRVLTIFSVFFMPLTFIVGIYGMNFQHMPELTWKFGYPFAMGLMAVVVIGIYIWFKKKKWL